MKQPHTPMMEADSATTTKSLDAINIISASGLTHAHAGEAVAGADVLAGADVVVVVVAGTGVNLSDVEVVAVVAVVVFSVVGDNVSSTSTGVGRAGAAVVGSYVKSGPSVTGSTEMGTVVASASGSSIR